VARRLAEPYDWADFGPHAPVPTQVAEWAGHSVGVLPRIYAKCIVGQDDLAKRRISETLRQT
jgi:hypothetical protein